MSRETRLSYAPRLLVALAWSILLTACDSEPASGPAAQLDLPRDAGGQPLQEAALPDAGELPEKMDRRMAITVDDLPVAFFNDLREGERRDVVKAWGELLERRSVPVTGFVIARNLERQPELFDGWQGAGISFGNHTWSHPRLQKIGLEAYLRDLSKGHEALAKRLRPDTTIPFRYPYLYRGFSEEERVGVREGLAELGSPLAPVTVDTRDYYYARRYTEARRAGDSELVERIVRAWRWDMEESTERAEWRARELFGHEPPQILLIHANELNARHLEGYLDWLVERGYRFISLSEALEDPAYQEEDRSLVPTGDSHWLRLRRSRELAL